MRVKTAAGGHRVPDSLYNLQWLERVKKRVMVTETGCWIWQGFCHGFRNQKPGQPGYGNTNYRGRGVRVHRKMLELILGHDLPKHLHACHRCDNPPCCNPEHLYAATNSQNHVDGGRRGRMQGQWKTHCKNNHEFTPENTFIQVRGTIKRRICRQCGRDRYQRELESGAAGERQRRYRARRKAASQQGMNP